MVPSLFFIITLSNKKSSDYLQKNQHIHQNKSCIFAVRGFIDSLTATAFAVAVIIIDFRLRQSPPVT